MTFGTAMALESMFVSTLFLAHLAVELELLRTLELPYFLDRWLIRDTLVVLLLTHNL